MEFEHARAEVAETARELIAQKLIVNTSGNVSQRVGEFIAITPSSKAYQDLSPSDICLVDMRGDVVDGALLPSSETELHLELYRSNASCQAIVHTHSMNATAISMIASELPSIHYQMVDLGGAVPVAPYATFGSPELAASVRDTIQGHTAAIMENHGAITLGSDLSKALSRSILLEWCAQTWLLAKTIGDPKILSPTQMEQAKEQMEYYSKQRDNCTCHS